jgi:hypothetical protein
MWEAFRTAAGMHSYPDLGLSQSRVIAGREAHVAGQHELAAHTTHAASDLRDANHRSLGETDERIHEDWEPRRPDGCGERPPSISGSKRSTDLIGGLPNHEVKISFSSKGLESQ